ncbi:MAG: hypothetical protein HPY53_03700 [Brevinematales bacterium]|nr:hypothetical protein [Brevinematales bacterium]
MIRFPYILFFLFIASFSFAKELTHNDAEKILKDHIKLYENYQVGSVNKEWHEKIHKNYDDVLYPSLDQIKKLVCKNKDVSLLDLYIQFLVSTRNSAAEAPRWILGDMYLSEPDMVLAAINRLEGEKRKLILKDLEFGFDNIVGALKNKIKKEIEKE